MESIKEVFIQKIITKLQTCSDNLNEALNKARNSKFTQILSDKDKTRDNAFLSFRDFDSFFVRSEDTAIAGAAQ